MGVFFMLGLGDYSIFFAMAGCLIATLVCVIYGVLNWNDKQGSSIDNKNGEQK
jgi:hypothetical protein